MFYIAEVQKKKEGIHFDEKLSLKTDLMVRNTAILDLTDVSAKGVLRHEEGLYILSYDLAYTIVLASSRSMKPVDRKEAYSVTEIFAAAEDLEAMQEEADRELFLVAEGGRIDLAESVADNILLNIPLKVLTAEEEAGTSLPQGENWQVLTEEGYAQIQADKKAESSPFAGLAELLEDDS